MQFEVLTEKDCTEDPGGLFMSMPRTIISFAYRALEYFSNLSKINCMSV